MSIITAFLIILVAVFATVAYFTEPTEADKRICQRLNELDRQSREGNREEEIVRRMTFSRNAVLDRLLRNHALARNLQLMLEQAKLPWTVGRFFSYSAAMVIVGAIAGNVWISDGFAGWIPGLALGAVPFLIILNKRAARFRRFNMLLPDATDLIARGLRAGHSLSSALIMVADEMADPLGPEFRRTADELNYGMPFREALQNLGRRFPLQDLQFLLSAILLQKETGGNLAELLDKTAALLRSRIQLQQKVRVHTAQGKLTGGILVALPFICFAGLSLLRPGYGQLLFDNEIGRRLVYGTLVSITIGIVLIRRIIQVKY
jgi:tight adherence protein B